MRILLLAPVLALAAFAAVQGAAAETINVKADLEAASETPPTKSSGTSSLTGTFDTASKTLSWKVTYSDLTGPATMAHFHGPAPVGKPAPVEVPLTGSLASPIDGSAVLTDAHAKDLLDGNMYFNIHTAANKAGEIRGQMVTAK